MVDATAAHKQQGLHFFVPSRIVVGHIPPPPRRPAKKIKLTPEEKAVDTSARVKSAPSENTATYSAYSSVSVELARVLGEIPGWAYPLCEIIADHVLLANDTKWHLERNDRPISSDNRASDQCYRVKRDTGCVLLVPRRCIVAYRHLDLSEKCGGYGMYPVAITILTESDARKVNKPLPLKTGSLTDRMSESSTHNSEPVPLRPATNSINTLIISDGSVPHIYDSKHPEDIARAALPKHLSVPLRRRRLSL